MIPVFRPWFDEEELEALREPFATGWIGMGPKTKQFEDEFAAYVGAADAVAVNSATSALHLALHVVGVTGGEVICPALTFASTALAAVYCGARPVFADVDPETLCLDPADVERKITPQTKALIPVHYGGHACDLDALRDIAEPRGIAIVEDAAHACGSEYKGRKVGGLGPLTCFSFHAVKNLACGDGGMITTTDGAIAGRLRKLRWLGIDADTWKRASGKAYSWYYEIDELGWKYHMNDITAAIGLVQLSKLDRGNARRREVAARYSESFADLDWVETPVERPYTRSACHNYVIKVPCRDELQDFLRAREIATGVHYLPLHHHPIFAHCSADVPATDLVWKRILTLPLFPGLTDQEVEHVIASVRGFPREARRDAGA